MNDFPVFKKCFYHSLPASLAGGKPAGRYHSIILSFNHSIIIPSRGLERLKRRGGMKRLAGMVAGQKKEAERGKDPVPASADLYKV
jgi:hypothetical protein